MKLDKLQCFPKWAIGPTPNKPLTVVTGKDQWGVKEKRVMEGETVEEKGGGLRWGFEEKQCSR